MTMALLMMVGCSPLCGYTTLSTLPSPNGIYSASVIMEGCGATDGGTQIIVLHPSGMEPDPDGDIILATLDGSDQVVVEWNGDSEIEISTNGNPTRGRSELGGVGVKFRKIPEVEVPPNPPTAARKLDDSMN